MDREIYINGVDRFYVVGKLYEENFQPFHGLHTDQVIPMVLARMRDIHQNFADRKVSLPTPDDANPNYLESTTIDGKPFSQDQQNGLAFFLLSQFMAVIIEYRGVITIQGESK